MLKPHEEWFFLADDDLAFAKSGFKDEFFAHVCCLSQQAVEKAIKGFLVWEEREYPKIHNLIELHRLMKVDWLDDYLVPLKKLSAFYIPMRYPDAIAGSLPDGLPDKEDASDALKWADEIVDLIEKHTR